MAACNIRDNQILGVEILSVIDNIRNADPWNISLLVISIFSVVSMIFIVLRFNSRRNEYIEMKNIVDPILIFMFPMILVGLVFLSSRLMIVLFADNIYNQAASFALIYASYFFFWVIGMNRFMKGIIRLSRSKMLRYSYLQKLLYMMALIGVLQGIAAFFVSENIYEQYFAFIALLAFISFIYFYKVVRTERSKQSSKLMKSRLTVFSYSILFQVFISVILIGGAIILSLDLFPANISESIFFSILQFFALTSVVLLRAVVEIPEFIRIRFNISSSRFENVLEAEQGKIDR